MAEIGKTEKRVVLREWASQFVEFRPLTKLLYVRLNDFVLTGIEFNINPQNSYSARVFLHCFNHEEVDTIYFDSSCDYHYSMARHRLGGIKYLGDFEEFPDFCERVKNETVVGSNLDITKLIGFCRSNGENSFYTIRAVTTAHFYRDGFTAAQAYLESKEPAFRSWNPAIQALLGGSFASWREAVLATLDEAFIAAQKAALLAQYPKAKLRDYGILRR